MNTNRQTIPLIIDQHAEGAAFLWLLRDAAVAAPHYSLKDLAGLDNRVEAHLDGLRSGAGNRRTRGQLKGSVTNESSSYYRGKESMRSINVLVLVQTI